MAVSSVGLIFGSIVFFGRLGSCGVGSTAVVMAEWAAGSVAVSSTDLMIILIVVDGLTTVSWTEGCEDVLLLPRQPMMMLLLWQCSW